MSKRLYRSTKDKQVAGVCGGIAEYFKIDPTIVRIVFVIIAISTLLTAFIVYLITAIVVPEMPSDYVPDETEVETNDEHRDTRQTLGIILVGAGGLILLSRVVSWFDSSMILAVGIIVVGAFILFRRND